MNNFLKIFYIIDVSVANITGILECITGVSCVYRLYMTGMWWSVTLSLIFILLFCEKQKLFGFYTKENYSMHPLCLRYSAFKGGRGGGRWEFCLFAEIQCWQEFTRVLRLCLLHCCIFSGEIVTYHLGLVPGKMYGALLSRDVNKFWDVFATGSVTCVGKCIVCFHGKNSLHSFFF